MNRSVFQKAWSLATFGRSANYFLSALPSSSNCIGSTFVATVGSYLNACANATSTQY